MTLNIRDLSQNMGNIIKNTDFSSVQSATEDAINKFDASTKSILGSTIGEVKGGIQSINKVVDDAQDALELTDKISIGKITANVPNVADKLIGNVSSSVGENISKITGSAAAATNGFIEDVVTSTAPEAVSAALTNVTGESVNAIRESIESLTIPDLRGVALDAVQNTVYTQFQQQIGNFKTQLGNIVDIKSGFFLLDLGEKIEKTFESSLLNLVDEAVPIDEIKSSFALVANNSYIEAFDNVRRYIDVPDNYDFIISTLPRSEWSAEIVDAYNKVSDVEEKFNLLSAELSSYSKPFSEITSDAGKNTKFVKNIGNQVGERSSTDTNGDSWNFDDIGSADELESMFRSINRPERNKISGAIIHWSATFLDQNIGSDWLHRVHKQRGFSGIGYHIIIRRDGTLQRGRPLNRVGAHDSNNNNNFLGFCLVGGINEVSSRARKPYWKYASADSLTAAQFISYDLLMEIFHKVFPYAQVQGHYATSNEGKVDPGFDVAGYSQAKFDHINVIEENDPIWKSSTPITTDLIRNS